MKQAKLNDLFLWKGELVKVVGIAIGKTIIFEKVGEKECECCGMKFEYNVLEQSPLFQENADPVKTIKS